MSTVRGLAVLAAIFLAWAPIAFAKSVDCTTSIQGDLLGLEYDDEESILYQNMTFREIFLGGWGDVTCPAFVTLRALTPELTDLEREPFCLQYDKEEKTYLGYALGERNAYLVCKEPSKPLCERVNDTKDAAIAITGIGAGASGGATLAASAAGVTAVTHSSGAVILTGAGGYIAGTLGTLGASILSILTAPATLAVAAVSVVSVGGAVYFCR